MRGRFLGVSKKTGIAILAGALIFAGISAQASGVLNSPAGGYLFCVNSKTSALTHPGTSKCPVGSKKLILGAQGTPGVNGATGLAGQDGKTIWNGAKDPEITLGVPGDFFINTITNNIFGPKNLDGTWPIGVPMTGPQGPRGAQGQQGSTGAQGAQGAQGDLSSLTCAQGGTCIVGDRGPGGGIVFYVQTATSSAPWRYLEAAPSTWSGGAQDPTIAWCSGTSAYVNSLADGTSLSTTLTSLGGGFKNTKMMLGACTFGAANMATSYNGGGKGDWFLPSKDELYQLYLQKTLVGGFTASFYWSSSEATSSDPTENGALGWRMYSSIGVGSMNFKYTANGVRPIRAF